jgi:hypothetical protein
LKLARLKLPGRSLESTGNRGARGMTVIFGRKAGETESGLQIDSADSMVFP